MNKKVAFGTKPERSSAAELPAADAWVQDRKGAADTEPVPSREPTKRLTIDVSPELHRRIKVQCAQEGMNIADVIRELLESRFPANQDSR